MAVHVENRWNWMSNSCHKPKWALDVLMSTTKLKLLAEKTYRHLQDLELNKKSKTLNKNHWQENIEKFDYIKIKNVGSFKYILK